MSPSELPILVAVVGALVLNGAFAVALVFWGRWVAQRQGGGRWRYVAWAPLVGFALNTLGLALTIVGLIHAFDAVALAPPEQKVAQLAEGITFAMRATAILAPIAVVLYVGSTVAFLVGSLRAPRGELGG
ncbi:MAG: hypothetical protein Q8P18_32965 [Pseudomonadota bacterium]|nr:hypothetical protein [Pseudomonadota bacterium]